MTIKFEHPLSPADHASAITLLLSTKDGIEIGGCFLRPDRDAGLIWGTDFYGQDAIAASKFDIEGVHEALEWVNSVHRLSAEFRHPAEGGISALPRQCRICGCSENHACEGGCWWVEYDLCSSCQTKAGKPIRLNNGKDVYWLHPSDARRIESHSRSSEVTLTMHDGARLVFTTIGERVATPADLADKIAARLWAAD